MKKIFCVTAGIISSLAFSLTAFAGTWQQTGAGWTYLKDNNQYAANELVADNNQLYYLGADGVMKTGFVPINNQYYYFTPAGNMQTGWVLDNGAWYYMQTDAAHFGQMAVNVNQNVNGKNYYFGADGKMVHDTTIGQVTYGADGAAVTGMTGGNNAAYGVTDDLDDDYANVGDTIYASFGNDDTVYLVNKDGSLTDYSHQVLDHDESVNTILNLVNKERAKAGLSALTLDSQLCQIADARANEVITDYSHDGFAKYKPIIKNNYRICGENVGDGTPLTVMKAWLSDIGHRDNILYDGYSAIGIGMARSSSGMYLFSQVFAG